MTNAELAKHFASLPPDETATITILNADSGIATDEEIVGATARMLEQIEDETFIDSDDLPADEDPTDEEREALADKGRADWLGTPVIFQKY